MANWLQGWDMGRHGSTGSSGLVPPTEKQVTDAAMMYALYMAPMTRLAQSVTGALVRFGAKRIVPPSGISLARRAFSMTPAGSLVQMGKGTLYRYLDHSNRDRTVTSQSPDRSLSSYQQSGYSGGTINPRVNDAKFNRSLRVKPTNIHGKRGYHIPTHLRCPPGYKLTHMGFGRYACLPN
jgi:hypothetical protein